MADDLFSNFRQPNSNGQQAPSQPEVVSQERRRGNIRSDWYEQDDIFPRRRQSNQNESKAMILANIKQFYNERPHHQVRKVEQKNVLLIGRTRSGKSTLKQVLMDPKTPATDMQLGFGTKEPTFESFIIDDEAMVINIIDTPGLFQNGDKEAKLRNNQTIITTIKKCIQREITKLHLICFCVSFESGVNDQDVKAIEELAEFLGPDASKVCCWIITRCESKSEQQRKALTEEVMNHRMFQSVCGYFKKGILFSGSIDHDSWKWGSDNVYTQFENVINYRDKIIDLLKKDDEPFSVDQSKIKDFVEPKTQGASGDEHCSMM